MKIPDTLESNYGNLVFGTLLENSYFGIISGVFDSITVAGTINIEQIPFVKIKYGGSQSDFRWDYSTHEYECYFIPKRIGKSFIEIVNGRIEMNAKDGKSWLVNPLITLPNNEKRYNQYLSWMEPTMRNEALSIITKKQAWYCFEVK